MKPRHEHDSDCCTYLGTTKGRNNYAGKTYDHYICKGVVISRYSDHGPDYLATRSELVKMHDHQADYPLQIAVDLAEGQGLLV
jgi:hypothetical protein